MTAPTYRLIEKPERIHAIDENEVEICGARRPYGHQHFVIYTTPRITDQLHQVLATTRSAAKAHVEMLAQLFTGSRPAGGAEKPKEEVSQ